MNAITAVASGSANHVIYWSFGVHSKAMHNAANLESFTWDGSHAGSRTRPES